MTARTLGLARLFAVSTVILWVPAAPSVAAASAIPSASAAPAEEASLATFPQGVAAGDVTSSTAVLWTRTAGARAVTLEVATSSDFARPLIAERHTTRAEDDFTLHAPVAGLPAATRIHYRFLAEVQSEAETGTEASQGTAAVAGSFRSAPAADSSDLPHFLSGGDLGGQGYCRSLERGYPIFEAMLEDEPDLFLANGDMIYADGLCPAEGSAGRRNVPGDFPAVQDPSIDWRDRAAVDEVIWAHWRYNRADAHHRAFLARVPMVVQWDDHEAINDFGFPEESWPLDPSRPGWRTMLEAARDALFLWNPIARHPDEPRRIYRSFRWGRHVELFIVDARSYRDPNRALDGPEKTLLGAAQRRWLEAAVTASDATWKIVSLDVPLSIPTGARADLYGRDAFAAGTDDDYSKRTGAPTELRGILRAFDAADVENLLFVVTDVHHPMFLRYDLDLDGDGDSLVAHELISGPLTAGMVRTPRRLDPSLQPTILYGDGGFFNYLDLRFERGPEGDVRAVATIRDESGAVRPGSRLVLDPGER